MKSLPHPMSVLFVHVAHPILSASEIEKDITELWNLVKSMGNAEVIDIFLQKGQIFKETYIGPGKADEVAEYLKTHAIDVIICNGKLTSNQKFNLTKRYWDIRPTIQVWDRIDLILSIFSHHAHTKEAELQIELARMHHAGPSIYGMGKILSRQGGGIGTRGIGETNTELMKRHWRREIKRVTNELEHIQNTRLHQLKRRKDAGLHTISLVGYTNAGKTTLFNLLTHKNHPVSDALFVTLDSTVGKMFIEKLNRDIIISDTIGFIKDLPPDLIDAFTSTLIEAVHADIILHIIDASDPEIYEKINVVSDILHTLKISKEKILFVINKIDIANNFDITRFNNKYIPYPTLVISSKDHVGIDELKEVIIQRLLTQ
jgi:GTPase